MITGGTFYVVRCDHRRWDSPQTCREETAPQRTQQQAIAHAIRQGWDWATTAPDLGRIFCPDHLAAEQAHESLSCPECAILGQPSGEPGVLECPGCGLNWEQVTA